MFYEYGQFLEKLQAAQDISEKWHGTIIWKWGM